jgi:hypothetical protein
MAESSDGLFRRLTLLFRSGPVIKRRVKQFDGKKATSSAFEVFKKTQSHVYSTAMSAYGTYDRMARYSDFSEMEYTPEISSGLDIYSEESVATDEKGRVLHIHSENPKIEALLEDLFFDTLNVEFNLSGWVRNLCKYGDFFLFNDVSPEFGVINAYPMPVNEVEREEGFDPDDPLAVRFRWVTQGNQVLENWQVAHFRLLGNDAFLPYGSSVLEAARRIWRQLILIEDAMLVYRVIRSPERRVFYVDVGNVPPEDIPAYMEQVQTSLKRSQVVDSDTGRVDLRYNPLSVDEDYYLPVRGSEQGTKIETLAGGQNTTAIEDVEYIQAKLFAALKIPKAYLGYDEGLGAKATLSQEDIRFSRTINRIQRTIVAELNKIAIIHLFSNGFEGEDLLDFDLQLSNPSTIAQQQKLELFRTRFEIAGTVPEGIVDKEWVRKNVLGLTDDEIEVIKEGRFEDRISDLEIESASLPVAEGELPGLDLAGGGEEMGGLEAPPAIGGDEEAPPIAASDIRNNQNLSLLAGEKESLDEEDFVVMSISDESSPIRAQNRVDKFLTLGESQEEREADDDTELERALYNRKRRRKKRPWKNTGIRPQEDTGPAGSVSGDPTGMKNLSYDLNSLGKLTAEGEYNDKDENFINGFLDKKIRQQAKMTGELKSSLKYLERRISIPRNKILVESDSEKDK